MGPKCRPLGFRVAIVIYILGVSSPNCDDQGSPKHGTTGESELCLTMEPLELWSVVARLGRGRYKGSIKKR